MMNRIHPIKSSPRRLARVGKSICWLCLGLGLGFLRPAAAQDEVVANGVLRVGTIDHFAISEGSGLAASRRFPGVIWTHNDGGYQFLFALTESGEWLGGFQVVGANLIDWEAIAADNAGNLYLADIGGNGITRTHVAVHRVKEPNPSRGYGNAEVTKTWYLRFPGVKEDCEAFFVHDGFGYLMTKPRVDGQVTLYRYSLASGGSSVLLEEVTKISLTASVTDASISSDGVRLGILTSQGAYLMFIHGNPATANTAQREFTPFVNDFMEGGTFVERGFLVSAESRELWLFTNGGFRCDAPAGVTTPLVDRAVLAGGILEFDPGAVGCPPPTFVWTLNGETLPGQTNATLVVPDVSSANAGLYTVTVSNRFGVATSSANITLRSKPDLRVTEVMPLPVVNTNITTADWWELTSFESIPVDLTGWRFNDSVGGLLDPYRFTSGPIIEPGETIVFVEGLTPEEFRAWWGDANLPPLLRIIPYSGSGLSFRGTGDTLLLWDNVASDSGDTVARVEFGAADPGVSFGYDPVTQSFGIRSQLGLNGAIQAAGSADIGSPGRIAAPAQEPVPSAPVLVSRLAGEKFRIEFNAMVGTRYVLEACENLGSDVWRSTGDSIEPSVSGPASFEPDRASGFRLFRVRALEAD